MRNYKIEINLGKQDSDKGRKFITTIEAPSALAAERMANDLVNIKVTPIVTEKESFDIMDFFKNNVFKISVIIVFFIASGCGREVKVSTPTAVETFEVSTYVMLTNYNATSAQCDSTPLITADGSHITKSSLNNWCAVSRDLLEIYKYGDTITVEWNYGKRELIIHDTMNKRYTNCVDMLTDTSKIGRVPARIIKEINYGL